MPAEQHGALPAPIPAPVEFSISGLGAMGAITFCNPMDVVKTRLQLQKAGGAGSTPQYQGVAGTLCTIARQEGIRGLQKGLSAVYLLQFSNVGTRFGGYGYIKKLLGLDTAHTQKALLFAAGALSGALAAVVSNPFYLLKTRLQADASASNPLTLRQAVRELLAKEGVLGFWRGVNVFIPRTAAASSVQLSVYDIVKPEAIRLLRTQDGLPVHIVSSFVTGVAVVLAMQPFDFTATRMMSDPVRYPSLAQCLRTTLSQEGPAALYQGTLANYLRFGPYCVLVFVFTEQLRNLYRAGAAG